jgi:hypothetical protein
MKEEVFGAFFHTLILEGEREREKGRAEER